MKKCTRCKHMKSLTAFWKSKNAKDGHKSFCNECGQKENKDYHVNGYMRNYMKNYYQTHEEQRKIKGDRASIYNKSKDRIRIYVRVSDYIKQGKIIKKPCEVCGDKNVHGHHKDYSKPLELTWLCPMHHKQLHKGMITV